MNKEEKVAAVVKVLRSGIDLSGNISRNVISNLRDELLVHQNGERNSITFTIDAYNCAKLYHKRHIPFELEFAFKHGIVDKEVFDAVVSEMTVAPSIPFKQTLTTTVSLQQAEAIVQALTLLIEQDFARAATLLFDEDGSIANLRDLYVEAIAETKTDPVTSWAQVRKRITHGFCI